MIKLGKDKIVKDKRKFSTFLVFLGISTFLWLLITLSQSYTTQTIFTIHYVDVPANKWMEDPRQPIKLSFSANGFKTLKHNMMRKHKRCLEVSLKDTPYRNEKGDMFSFSSHYIAEGVANILNIKPHDITVNENTIYFTMENLNSKVVPVIPLCDIRFQKQFELYGKPTVSPQSVTIYGSERIIDTINHVKTLRITKDNVSSGFKETIGLDLLDGRIRSKTTEAVVSVDVERYTEKTINVRIEEEKDIKLRYFPEEVSVKCLVAIRDFKNLDDKELKVEIDRKQLQERRQLLNVQLTKYPQGVRPIKIEPEKIEYIIIQP